MKYVLLIDENGRRVKAQILKVKEHKFGKDYRIRKDEKEFWVSSDSVEILEK
ncbi:hypothetical protein ACU82A_25960 [Bacillus cereus]